MRKDMIDRNYYEGESKWFLPLILISIMFGVIAFAMIFVG